MNAARRIEILDAYTGHARRFDVIAARRRTSAPARRCESHSASGSHVERLSRRQLEVLMLVAEGLSNQEICVELEVTLETVKSHVLHILQRLSARSRAHAVGIAYKNGLLA